MREGDTTAACPPRFAERYASTSMATQLVHQLKVQDKVSVTRWGSTRIEIKPTLQRRAEAFGHGLGTEAPGNPDADERT